MSDSAEPQEFTCPTCGEGVQATPDEAAQLVLCPHCGHELVIPNRDGSTDLPDDVDPEADESASELPLPPDPQADELDGLRIRQLAQGRRATYRSRSYAFIAALVCLVAAIQLCLNAGRRFLHHIPGIRPYAYLCFALAFIMAFFFFMRRTVALTRELRQSRDEVGAGPAPDFSTLSDGSQHWKNLDEIE